MKYLMRFWASIGFFLTLYGIFWLPKDIEDQNEASQVWGRLFAMLDQNTALWIFSLGALTYIFWIDARPFIRRSREKTRITEETKDKLVSFGQFVNWNGEINRIRDFAPQIPLQNISASSLTVKVKIAKYNFFGREKILRDEAEFTLQPYQETRFNCELVKIENKDISEGAGYLCFEVAYGRGDFLPHTLKRKIEMKFVRDNFSNFRIIARDLHTKS